MPKDHNSTCCTEKSSWKIYNGKHLTILCGNVRKRKVDDNVKDETKKQLTGMKSASVNTEIDVTSIPVVQLKLSMFKKVTAEVSGLINSYRQGTSTLERLV